MNFYKINGRITGWMANFLSKKIGYKNIDSIGEINYEEGYFDFYLKDGTEYRISVQKKQI